LVHEFAEYVKAGVKLLAKKMSAGIIAYTHDFYLKLYQLSKPKLPYTHILFDEAQDASPVMLDIFKRQHHATKVMVGDSSQAIYGYRMATNALQSVDYEQYSLTNSFRFGEYNARMANNILSWKKDIGKYTPGTVTINGVGGTKDRNTKCYISRSNIGVLESLIDEGAENVPQSFYLEGGIKGYPIFGYNSVLNDVMSLYYSKHSQIKNPFIRSCSSVSELVKKAESIGDNEIKGFAKLVNIHGGDLRKHIKHLKGRMNPERSNADVIFSTVHKSKGLEYDEVILANDFVNYSDIKLFAEHYRNLEKKDIFAEKRREELNEEINILYVAVTRSRNIIRKAA
jgi:F-box protein 18 (helicase)